MQERGPGKVHQREERVPEEVFKARPPRIAPYLLERPQNARDDEILLRLRIPQDVEGDCMPPIRRIEVDEVVPPLFRHPRADTRGDVPMRVEQRHTRTGPHIGMNQMRQKR